MRARRADEYLPFSDVMPGNSAACRHSRYAGDGRDFCKAGDPGRTEGRRDGVSDETGECRKTRIGARKGQGALSSGFLFLKGEVCFFFVYVSASCNGCIFNHFRNINIL